MSQLKKQFLKLFICFGLAFAGSIDISNAQLCGGHWVNDHPLTFQCISGQQIGYNNFSDPSGCPINPNYTPPQTNTFVFDNPFNDFVIDFNAFSATPNCARIQIKINNVFYPLTSTNLIEIPVGTNCTGSASNLIISPEGYITGGSNSANNMNGQGRLLFSGVNATSLTISTNDGGGGSVFTSPCSPVIVPLELKSFVGIGIKDCKAILTWETGIESNIKNIEVLRKEEGNKFNTLAVVMPKGSDSHYIYETDNFKDASFKLKINDLDGTYSYSQIIHVKSICGKIVYQIRPNPAQSFINITHLKNNDGILVFDMLGKKVLAFNAPQADNKYDIQSLAPGVYILQITNDQVLRSQFKIIKN